MRSRTPFERFSSRPSRLSFATFAVKAFLFISRQKAFNREDREGSAKIAKNIIRPTTNVVGEGSTCLGGCSSLSFRTELYSHEQLRALCCEG